MTTRGGNDSKKGQKYQNVFTFKHNKNSLLTRKIRETPLDLLCKRCLEKLEWKINYRKYKPLSVACKCITCEQKNIYKAYRAICDKCAIDGKICSMCFAPCKSYAKPTCWKNDPSKKNKYVEGQFEEIVKNLKVRNKRTVERKIREGEDLIFDKERGIVNEDTGEVIVDIKIIESCGAYEGKGNDDDEEDEEEEDENEDIDGVDKLNLEKINLNANTNKNLNKDDSSSEQEFIDGEDQEEGEESEEEIKKKELNNQNKK